MIRRLLRDAVLTLVVAWLLMNQFASAQIVEMRKYQGKWINCVTSGLRGFSESCGIDRGYEFVFVGTVLSATEISESERRLELSSEEAFFGNVPTRLTVETGQGWCLPELRQGARWLFYIQRQSNSKDLILFYGSPSGPLPEAQARVDHLRRLQRLNAMGILRGHVSHGVEVEEGVVDYGNPVVGHKVIARNVADGRVYEAATNSESTFEFETLPPGKYEVNANSVPGLWAKDGIVDISAHDCSFVGFELREDGRITGTVRTTDGRAIQYAEVEVHPADPDHDYVPGSAWSNERGEFDIRGLKAGSYVVSVSLPKSDTAIYYPNTRDRTAAEVIVLGRAQSRSDLNFFVARIPDKEKD